MKRGSQLPAPARNRLRANDDDGDLHFPRGAAVIVSARPGPQGRPTASMPPEACHRIHSIMRNVCAIRHLVQVDRLHGKLAWCRRFCGFAVTDSSFTVLKDESRRISM